MFVITGIKLVPVILGTGVFIKMVWFWEVVETSWGSLT